MKKSALRAYARLIVCVGANIQKKQGVVIYASTGIAEFARLVASEAYRAGAGHVTMMWNDQRIEKLAYQHETLTELSKVPEWMLARQLYFNDTLPAEIHLLSDDPEGLRGLSPKKYAEVRRRVGAVVKPLRDARENKHQWTIAGVPSPEWAKKVFPKLRASSAVNHLWEEILKVSRVSGEPDPVAAWEAHNARLAERSKILTDYNFDRIFLKSKSGTDLEIGLIDGAAWMGGAETTESGVVYNPNIPTEEVFTTPQRGRVSGVAVATKPLSLNGRLIEDFSVTFKDGRAVSCSAKHAEEALKRLIAMDEGASMLGEVALIGKNSPVNRAGKLFYETLFDENAACHIALGMGFINVLPDFSAIARDKWTEYGVNDSIIHADFMIGAPDMSVSGMTRAGERVTIFEDGDWAL